MAKLANLDTRVRVERRRELTNVEGDGAGNFEAEWVVIGPQLRCAVREIFQGSEEAVQAGALGEIEQCKVTLRSSAFTRGIVTSDRFVIAGTNRVLNIRHAPPPGRAMFIEFACEAGVAT